MSHPASLSRLLPLGLLLGLLCPAQAQTPGTPSSLAARPDGTYLLTANDAAVEGDTARIEKSGDASRIGHWISRNDMASWTIGVPTQAAGTYTVSVEFACDPRYAGSAYALTFDGAKRQTLTQTVTPTRDWDAFETMTLSQTVTLSSGVATVRMRASALPSGDLINLRRIVLTPVPVRVHALPEPKFHIAAYLPEYHALALNPALIANVTDLIFFSLEPTPEGGIDCRRLSPAIEEKLAEIKRRYPVRLIAAFGGADRSQAFAAMSTDPGRRHLFVADLAQFLTRRGYGGVDFDWEFPDSPAEKDGLTALVVETKRALAPLGLRVSVATAPGDWFDSKLIAAVDRFNLMSYYDETHQATLAVSQSDVDHLLRNGARPGQIWLGLPFFAENTATGSDEATYYARLAQKYALTPKQDAVDGYTFNGVQTVRDKTQYALDRNLGGVMIFELGQDTTDGALSHAIHNLVSPEPSMLEAEPDVAYRLTADAALIQGPAARTETSGGISDIGYWDSMDDTATWKVSVPTQAAGTYTVSVEFACDPRYAGSAYALTFDSAKRQTLTQTVTPTRDWDTFETMTLSQTVTLSSGVATVRMQASALPSGDLINLRRIILTPARAK
jgi:hypothetical protein